MNRPRATKREQERAWSVLGLVFAGLLVLGGCVHKTTFLVEQRIPEQNLRWQVQQEIQAEW